jgi:hypothetical protein
MLKEIHVFKKAANCIFKKEVPIKKFRQEMIFSKPA